MFIRNFKVGRPIYAWQTYFWKIKHMKTVVEPPIIFSFQSISKVQTNIMTEKNYVTFKINEKNWLLC